MDRGVLGEVLMNDVKGPVETWEAGNSTTINAINVETINVINAIKPINDEIVTAIEVNGIQDQIQRSECPSYGAQDGGFVFGPAQSKGVLRLANKGKGWKA